jgi:hypothetical protein
MAGKTTYRVNVATGPDQNGNFTEHGDAEWLNEANAKTYGVKHLAKHQAAYASIRKGTYMPEEYPDEQYGVVLDACWEEDERWYLDGWYDREGNVVWEGSL